MLRGGIFLPDLGATDTKELFLALIDFVSKTYIGLPLDHLLTHIEVVISDHNRVHGGELRGEREM